MVDAPAGGVAWELPFELTSPPLLPPAGDGGGDGAGVDDPLPCCTSPDGFVGPTPGARCSPEGWGEGVGLLGVKAGVGAGCLVGGWSGLTGGVCSAL